MDTNSFIFTLLQLKGRGPKRIYTYVEKHSFNYENCINGLVTTLNDNEKITFKQELIKSKIKLKDNKDSGISSCCILDKEFPKKLYLSTEKCVFLFYKGNLNLLSQKSISIIGTRKPSNYFIKEGAKATKYFAEKGYVVVSGLAIGCDSVAHKACLVSNGKTIAVLPSPCDNIQPTRNKSLADNIVNNGGLLISEYSKGTPISKYNYPQRDRIQSLLSNVILIIEASNESGTMIATKKSLKDGKSVFALKGNNLDLVENYIDANSIHDLEDIEKFIK